MISAEEAIEKLKKGNEQYLSEEFHNVKIRINGYEVSAFTDDIFYVFYAKSPEGNYGWYIYDSLEGRWLRFVFDFENN